MMITRGRQLSVATLMFVASMFALSYFKDIPNFFSRLSSEKDRQKVLIILTQTRCGSSFTGEVFAATNNSTYLYEPLYPFGFDCTPGISKNRKLRLLKQLLSCNFTNLDEEYKYGFSVSGWKDGASCRKDGFCFTGASVGLQDSYRKSCKRLKPNGNCGYPMRDEILGNVCQNSSLIIIKTTRVCSVEDLEDIYRHLKRMEKNTYVLHLVRDLRSIASSRMKLEGKSKIKKVLGEIRNQYCPRQNANIEYLDSVDQGNTIQSSIVAEGRYMRIRYEDFAINAIASANKVFQFMNLPLPSEVTRNIRNHLHPNITLLKERVKKGGEGSKQAAKVLQSFNNPFGSVRDPSKIVEQWRGLLPFEAVKSIQAECGDVLKKLGYELFESEEGMKDLSMRSY